MQFLKVLLVAALWFAQHNITVCQATTHAPAPDTNSFNIIAFGDMPYFYPQDYKRFENVISYLNTKNQAFNVFVGDIKSSKTNCADDAYHKMYNYFMQFEKPLIYTPGDNEWTDCYNKTTDSSKKGERLNFLRKTFFKNSKSLGKQQMAVVSQASYPGYQKFVENARWRHKGVAFATLHIVGSNNNYFPEGTSDNTEFFERSKANIAWLQEVFKNAVQDSSLGIVLLTHADMFFPDKGASGFDAFLKELEAQTRAYGKPVLLVNGDSHKYIVDKPLYSDDTHTKTLLNFTRVQVFGEYDMHAVKITINPSNPSLFEVQELLVPDNE
jgi:hypothetical protein